MEHRPRAYGVGLPAVGFSNTTFLHTLMEKTREKKRVLLFLKQNKRDFEMSR